MSSLKNSVRLIGNLGQNPEVKDLSNNNKLAKFSIATSETYNNEKGEKVTETNWHNIIAWGKLAGVAEKFLQKGREVAVEGKLTTRNYTDKEGNKKYVTEVVANEILLLGAKN
jgi:single-strand DNA-binding protein